MSDDEVLADLRTIFAERAEADDEGQLRRVTSMQVVAADDGFDDLEITLVVDGATVVSRLLFDRDWREESGLLDPEAYATYVEARWQAGLVSGDVDDDAAPPGRHDSRPDESWRELERALSVDAAGIHRATPGVWEVVDRDGDPFTVHVTPQQWRRAAAGRVQEALDQLDDVIVSRWDDEEYIVFFRGAFHPSVRVELPPLRSRLSLE